LARVVRGGPQDHDLRGNPFEKPFEIRAGEAVAWAIGRGDDDPVEVLLRDQVAERVSIGPSARYARIDVDSL